MDTRKLVAKISRLIWASRMMKILKERVSFLFEDCIMGRFPFPFGLRTTIAERSAIFKIILFKLGKYSKEFKKTYKRLASKENTKQTGSMTALPVFGKHKDKLAIVYV